MKEPIFKMKEPIIESLQRLLEALVPIETWGISDFFADLKYVI